MLLGGAAHGTIVTANSQYGGRGRRGRKFFSPAGSGIYMSIILKPQNFTFKTPSLVTAFAAVSVCKAIERLTGKSPRIKWVNDILLDEKKICGISADAVNDIENSVLAGIILGIGVNFRTKAADFPEELRDKAGSLFQDEEPTLKKDELLLEIAENILCAKHPGDEGLIFEYKNRMDMLGMRVKITGADAEYEASALDVDSEGRLVVRLDCGKVSHLSAGDVSVRGLQRQARA
jgi:BirA family biotin operon repressor/biotin-[acetyl-CoA-carboxylase] ligase